MSRVYNVLIDLKSMFNKLNKFVANEGFKRHFLNLGWMFFARIIGMVVSIIVSAYITRLLGPTSYGELSYALSLITLFSVFSSLGIEQVLYRELIKRPQDKNELLGSSIAIKIVAGSLTSLLVLVIAYISTSDPLSFWLVVIMSLSFLFNGWNIVAYEFQAEVKSRYPAIVTLYVTLVLSVIKLGTVVLGGGVIYLAAIVTLEQILYMIFFIFIRQKYIGSIKCWFAKWNTVKYLILSSFPLMISAWFIIIYTRVDQVIIKHLLDTKSVGLYDAGVRIAEALQFIPQFIVHSLFPALLGAKILNGNIYSKRFIRLTLFLIVITTIIAGSITVLAKPIILILYGSEFVASIGVLQIYSWAGVAVAIWYVAQYFLLAEDKQFVTLLSTFLVMVINVGLNFFLIPKYGIYGAAWATTISYFCGIIVLILYKNIRVRLYRTLMNNPI